MERPELTFIPEVSEFVRQHYQAADVILEYGSGGSTVLASEMDKKTIYSVESSRSWAKMMSDWFSQSSPKSRPMVQYASVGKTGKWGTPVDGSAFRRYHLYPCSIWDIEGFQHPDVILIDGRFRVACALTAMIRATKKTTVLFDDYAERKAYHIVEEFLPKDAVVGEMAKFTIEPREFPREKLTEIIGYYARHF